MKRGMFFILVAIVTLAAPSRAQDTNAASTAASQQAAQAGADERYERLASDVQALQTANEELQNRIGALKEEMQKLREAQAQAANNTGVADDVKHLAEKIEEVDRKRQEDKGAIADEVREAMAKVEKALSAGGSGPREPAREPPQRAVKDTAPPPDVKDGFVYTIKDGDNLSAIMKAYNADFKSKGMKTISLRQAREANPTVDWNRLKVGQKIVIPRPAE